MFLCYLVLLKAHLKISWLCKWALRRLKKGITGLRWAIHIAAGKGAAFAARHGSGWNVAFFYKLIRQTIAWCIDCLVREVWITELRTPVFVRPRLQALFQKERVDFRCYFFTIFWVGFLGFFFFFGILFWIFSHSPAIIQVAFCSCPSLWNGLCFQPLAICENRLECFIFRTYFGRFSCRVVSRIYIQLWKHWVRFKEIFTNIYKSEP